MQAKFAKAIAKNLRTMAETAAQVIEIDRLHRQGGPANTAARIDLVRAADTAENNLASLLMQPGAQLDDLSPAGIVPLTCCRCDHTWTPNNPGQPVICPKCKSPYWNKPRKNSPLVTVGKDPMPVSS